jgi:hypothetical protein
VESEKTGESLPPKLDWATCPYWMRNKINLIVIMVFAYNKKEVFLL